MLLTPDLTHSSEWLIVECRSERNPRFATSHGDRTHAKAACHFSPPSPAWASPLPDRNEITEISLERTPCFGTCPVDTITLHPDGTADYFGKMNVARIGHYKGRFNQDDFARLSKLLTDRKFFDFQAGYWPGITDQPGVATTVKRMR